MDLKIDEIKKLCTEASFERGKSYLEEGRVDILKATPRKVTAVVQGSEEYDVEVDLNKGISAECTCPYDWGGYCKHIVAVLLAMIEKGDEIEALKAESASEQKLLEALLEDAGIEEMRRFLQREMEALPTLKDHFIACFSRRGTGKSLGDYEKEIGRLYRGAGEFEGYIPYGLELDFSSFEELAELYNLKRDFLEAAKIYQALFEGIDERMDFMDDSEGHYAEEFSRFLDKYIVSIKEASLDAKSRRSYIRYLFGKYLRESDYFQDDYLDALEKLCVQREDIEYLMGLLEPHIPEKIPAGEEEGFEEYRLIELVSTKLRLLWDLGRKSDYYELIKNYYKYSADLCLSYAVALREDGEIEKSVKVAEEGLILFPDNLSISLREFLNEIYKSSDLDKYRDNLLWLFLNTGDWTHYETLKRVSTHEEWGDIFARIIDYFSQDGFNINKVINIYLREGMYELALKKVLESKNLFYLREHHKDLADRYSGEYFQAYRELIHSFAGRETGRRHYQEVVSYLKKMRDIKGFETEFAQFIDLLREENRRKRAFIEEMNVF